MEARETRSAESYNRRIKLEMGRSGRVTRRHHTVRGLLGKSWEGNETEELISIKETVLEALLSVQDNVKNKRVDEKVDNQNMIMAWENQGARSLDLNRAVVRLWELTRTVQLNVDLHLQHVTITTECSG